MDPQLFKNEIEAVHKAWAEAHLGFSSFKYGIDFLAMDYGFELKSRLVPGSTTAFTIHHEKIEKYVWDNPGRELYWMFMHYEMRKTVAEVTGEDIKSPGLVTRREINFVPWDEVSHLPVSRCKTADYVYVHEDEIPEPHKTFEMGETTIHVPESLEDFL